jgi:phenylalanyl-tRNA synthetase beta chain
LTAPRGASSVRRESEEQVKASYAWLRSLVPGLAAGPREIAERLTLAGLEVEDVVAYGAASLEVVVAEVRRVEPHPKRSGLTLVTVDRGGGEVRVVCGAPNVPAAGRRVVLAPVGTRVPGGTVEPREIGGVASQGMLVSEAELGLVGGGGKGEGILVLPERTSAAPGTPLARAMPGAHDHVLEINVTPNRPDALGHVGLAREIAALFELPFAPPEADAPARVATGPSAGALVEVEIADLERCPRYGAALCVEVAVGPSPDWVRWRLESLGVRAISNVVDVTNLVLLEFGQPMHAFDLDRLAPHGDKRRVVVRRARPGEPMRTLDGAERELTGDDLLITDGARPIALAGVMGGESTEILPETRRVLLECAYFQPRGVRRTSRRHGLASESSHRFERGTDPEAVPEVLAHAASLVTRLCAGAAVPGAILAGEPVPPRAPVMLRGDRLCGLLGLDVPLERARGILVRLGCAVEDAPAALRVTPPTFRHDLALEEDLIDEVIRVHGFEHVPATPYRLAPAAGRSKRTLEERARTIAAELGLSEALTYSMVAPRELAALRAAPAAVRLRNPLSEERSVLRTSLLPGLCEALGRARRHGVDDVRLFSVGRSFLAPEPGAVLPEERVGFAAVLAGARRRGGVEPAEPLDVYDAKGVALELVERLAGRGAEVSPPEEPPAHLHPRSAAEVRIGARPVGCFGALHPDVVSALDLGGPCWVVEIDLAVLGAMGLEIRRYRPLAALPPVTRDLALVAHEDVAAGALAGAIREAAGELCESVELFDLFRGDALPAEHRSLAYHLVFRDPRASSAPAEARTLTDEEVDACTARVVEAVGRRFGAVVRS